MTPETLAQRYALLCESTRVEPDEKMLPYEIEKGLNQLEHIITRDLREWAQSGAPDNFFDIDFALQRELERFKEFCAYPALAKKLVVAFGGGFSAGKSTLINTLLGEKLLVAEVDPTTALPTYILQGENNTINAFNLFGNRIELTESEFLSLTHDEMQIYGSNISRLLRAAFITRCNFAWNNIAFIDTPGYTKHEDGTQSDRTDAYIARTQLNAAQAVVWVIDVRQGCITEDDLKFLSGLQKDIPIFIALTRSDQKPESDIPTVQALISKTLQEHGIAFTGITPVSSRKPRAYPLDALTQQLNQWNQSPCKLRFANNFSTELNRYAEFLQTQLQQATDNLNRLNRIAAINDNETIQADAVILQNNAKIQLESIKKHITNFQDIETHFFNKLIEIGNVVDVDFSGILIKKSKNLSSEFFKKMGEFKFLYVSKSTDRLLWSLDRNNVCIALNNDTNIINPSSGYRTESIIISVIYKFTSNKSMRDTLDIMKAYSGENQILDNEPELVIKALEETLMDARADRLTISLRYAVDIKGSEEGEIMYFRNADLILFLDKVNLQILHKDSATFVNSQNTGSFEIKEAKLNALLISVYTKDGRECFLTDDSGPVTLATNRTDGEEHVIMEMLRKDNSLIEINRKRIPLKELNRRGIIFNHLTEAESELSFENKQHEADMQKKDMEISKLKLHIEKGE